MILVEERNRLLIRPAGNVDEAYIEEVLGLKKEGDETICRRVNVSSLLGLAYIEIITWANSPYGNWRSII